MISDEMLRDPRFVAVLDALPCKPHQNGWHDICSSCREAAEKLIEIYDDLEAANEKVDQKYGVLSSIEESIEHLYGVDENVTRYYRKIYWPQAHLFENGSRPVCPVCGSTDIRLVPNEPDRAGCSDCLEGPHALDYFQKKEVSTSPSEASKNPDLEDDVPF